MTNSTEWNWDCKNPDCSTVEISTDDKDCPNCGAWQASDPMPCKSDTCKGEIRAFNSDDECLTCQWHIGDPSNECADPVPPKPQNPMLLINLDHIHETNN